MNVWRCVVCAAALIPVACSSSGGGNNNNNGGDAGPGDGAPDSQPDGDPGDGGQGDGDSQGDSSPLPDAAPDVEPNWDAFFAEDPPPEYCGPGDRPEPELPGGTPECPDDKNREGFLCSNPDEQVPCWPGLRVDRNRGICRDGVTTCEPFDEFGYGRYGPCQGYVLPEEGATRGPEACNCFSRGRWIIDNVIPCFIEYNDDIGGVSTWMDGDQAHCPDEIVWPPEAQPGQPFSTNQLLVDCSGQFKLCFTLKAGDADNPLPTDCIISETCTEAWYDSPADGGSEDPTPLPDLPAWTSTESACITQFRETGGYGEMSVVGTSVECEEVGTEDEPYVFNVLNYCPSYCNEPGHEDDPECENCGNGASGQF